MMDTTTIVIAAVLVLILAGVLIGLYFALRGEQNKPPAQTPAVGRPDLVEVARLERDKETNMLMVVVDGKLYANASNLSFAQRQKLASATSELHKWLGLPVAPTSAPASYPPVPASVPPAAQPVTGEIPPEPVKPVSTNPLESFQRSIASNKPGASFKSIPAQIEEILQSKLLGTPFENRGIHLSESPTEGVIVQVGLEHYPGIDAVPDEAVRKLIRSAVAEWEQRNKIK